MKLRLLPIYFFTVILSLVIGGAILPTPATAAATQSDIFVTITPENPGPNENVSIAISSYAYNLDTVLISWTMNGKNVSSGIGKKTLSLQSPAAGSRTAVSATISLPDGTVEKNITIRPSVIVLLWQANDSYVPPFYRGKALPSPESQVKVVAIPDSRVNPKNMTYSWKKDYNNESGSSGYGKNFFTYTSDYLEDSNNISVTASTIDQSYSASSNINIGTTTPKIVFYKNDTNLGTLWEMALGNGHIIKGDEIIEAAPYFISPKNIRIPMLKWSWSINGSPVDNIGLSKNLMPITVQPGVSGTSQIKLEVENIYKIFANVSKEISVEF